MLHNHSLSRHVGTSLKLLVLLALTIFLATSSRAEETVPTGQSPEELIEYLLHTNPENPSDKYPQLCSSYCPEMAERLLKIREPEIAAELYYRGLLVRQQLDGEHSLSVGDMCGKLGGLLTRLGYAENAVEIFQLNLDIQKEHFGAESEEVARAKSDLGAALMADDQYDKAGKLFEEAIDTLGKINDETTLKDGTLYMEYAMYLEHLKQFDEALKYYQLALDGLTVKFGPTSRQVARVHHNIGVYWLVVGDLNKSLEELQAELDINKAAQWSHPNDIARLQMIAGRICVKNNDLPQAKQRFENALEALSSEYGPNTEHVGRGEYQIALIYTEEGQDQLALPHALHAEKLLINTLGHLDDQTKKAQKLVHQLQHTS